MKAAKTRCHRCGGRATTNGKASIVLCSKCKYALKGVWRQMIRNTDKKVKARR